MLLWFVVIALINPVGDFPLNDDWCYAKSVKNYIETGELILYNWGEMTLVGQVFYGIIFSKLFGFSFTVLRISTLLFAISSSLILYKLFRLVNMSKCVAFVATLLCILNPVFLELSFTYMTDIPFYCLSLYVFYYLLKYIRSKQLKYMVFALVACVLAYSIRQLAIVYTFAFMLYGLWSTRFNKKHFKITILPFGVFLLFALVFDFTLKTLGIAQERYNSKFYDFINKLLHFNKSQLIYSVNLTLTTLAYLGFFLSPFLMCKLQFLKRKLNFFLVIVYTTAAFLILKHYNYILPSLDNIWIDFGVGPFTLYYETPHFKKTPSPHFFTFGYYLLTLLGLFASSIFIYEFIKALRKYKSTNNAISQFTLTQITVYIFPFLIVGVYDRYLLFLYPLVLIVVLHDYTLTLNVFKKGILTFSIALLAYFSVAATHDYLSWNRARWQVLNQLTSTGVPTSKIYGGAEFITWYHFSNENKKFWEEVTPVYALVAEVEPEYKVVKQVSYSRWLPGKGNLYLIYNKHLDN